MKKRTLNSVRNEAYNNIMIIFFVLLFLIAFFFFITLLIRSELKSQIDALPHKVCHNETYFEQRAIFNSTLNEIPCPQNNRIYNLNYCYAINKEKVEYYNQSYQKEVCEIK